MQAMNKRFCTAVVALCFALSVAERASAYYAAHMGRFMSRDPGYGPSDRIGSNGGLLDLPATTRWLSRDDRLDTGEISDALKLSGYIDGFNLYQYAGGAPANRSDPMGLEDFYIVGQPIRPGGGVGAESARSCGCYHQDIYGDVSGPIRQGFGGAAGGIGGGGGLPQGPGWELQKLRRCDVYDDRPTMPKKVGWGSGAGKDCASATSAEIADCLASKPKPSGNPGLVSNCQTDVYGAAEDCCLCPRRPPLSIIPVIPPLPPWKF
jgi:hypothetical protein